MFNVNEETPVSHIYKLNSNHPEYYNLKLMPYNRQVKEGNQNVNRLVKSMKDNNLLYAVKIP